jgi:thymidylate synthase (FAD)
MHARLISYSQSPTMNIGDLYVPEGIHELVAYCARVSNPSNQESSATTEKLLSYLAREKHWSPFEMVSTCLEIETTRDIARQILRHRSFSFQEFSQRYADPKTQGEMFEYSEARLQDTKNRQNSIETDDKQLQLDWLHSQMRIAHLAKKEYDWAIKKGIAKEQARKVLPEGLTKSRMYVNGTLRSWLHFVDLRSSNGTQKEHREIARACAEVISKIYPNIMEYSHDD